MRSLMLLLLLSAVASADQTVVVQSPSTVVVVPAQQHAEYLARRNLFGHCSRRGHGHEGIGFSTVSPDAACRTACRAALLADVRAKLAGMRTNRGIDLYSAGYNAALSYVESTIDAMARGA